LIGGLQAPSYNYASWAYTAPQSMEKWLPFVAWCPIVIMEEVVMSTLEDDRLIDNLKL